MLGWTKPSGANVEGYRVYSYNPTTKTYKGLGVVSANSFKVTGLKQNTDYYYMVRSYYTVGGKTVLSSYSTILHAFTCYPAVTGLTVSSITSTGAALNWTKISGADGYNVYSVDSSGKLTSLADVASNSCKLTTLSKNTSYTIMVRAYKKINGVRYLGYNSASVTFKTKS